MMGFNHAISGAAAWVAVASTAPVFPAFGIVEIEPWQLITGAAVCAGAALLPDVDHHNSTIAHSVPVAGRIAAGAASSISGGHRHGLHSIVAIIACWFVTGYISTMSAQPSWWHQPIPWGTGIALAALFAFALKVLTITKTWPVAWLLGAIGAGALTFVMPDQMGWFQLCITVGFAAHIVGDFLTVEGINWFWPLTFKAPNALRSVPLVGKVWKRNGYFALPVLGRTGSLVEKLLGSALGLYALTGIIVSLVTAYVSV